MHEADWAHYATDSSAHDLWTVLRGCGGRDRWVAACIPHRGVNLREQAWSPPYGRDSQERGRNVMAEQPGSCRSPHQPIKVIVPNHPPEMTPAVARALLRLLINTKAKYDAQQEATAVDHAPDTPHEPSS